MNAERKILKMNDRSAKIGIFLRLSTKKRQSLRYKPQQTRLSPFFYTGDEDYLSKIEDSCSFISSTAHHTAGFASNSDNSKCKTWYQFFCYCVTVLRLLLISVALFDLFLELTLKKQRSGTFVFNDW